ncbi:hypothetical protein C8F01DRAFT_1145574 [Mycena amicta]|nr:hypothetical protein C8F01DRAFT_1145574 [Mycena amicta]
MTDEEAVKALASLRIQIDAVIADTKAIEYTLESYGSDPLRSLEAINDQMQDQSKIQQEHFEMQTRAQRTSSQADVQARIAELKLREAALRAEKREMVETSTEPVVESPEPRPARVNPKRTPTVHTNGSTATMPPPRTMASTSRRPPRASSLSATALPAPPAGFSTWPDLYSEGQMLVLAKAQSNAEHLNDPQKYGAVIVPLNPCSRCARLDIPCLVVDPDGRKMKNCIVCQSAKTHGACIAAKNAERHQYADAVAQYHNYAIGLGERPGMWMGPGVPALRPDPDSTSNASGLPRPPVGFTAWTEVYTKDPNMVKLATAQARLDLGNNPTESRTGVYGSVKVSESPCKQCVQMDIPCLVVDDPSQRQPSTGSRRCILCQVYRPPRLLGWKCILDETAEVHKHADAVAKYHNHAIANGERPGTWMGPGVPPLKVEAVRRIWGKRTALSDSEDVDEGSSSAPPAKRARK